MITFLQGQLVDKQPTRIVLDVNGVGYELFIPISSYDRLPSCDDPCRILTHDHVREDSHILFGFMTEDERRTFLLLVSISGIGPKLALSVLSGLNVREIRLAVADGDVKRLNSISGIGKKTAERIIVELRDKITQTEILEATAPSSSTDASDIGTRDAIMALIALGYKEATARKMVIKALDPDKAGASVEDIIKRALGG